MQNIDLLLIGIFKSYLFQHLIQVKEIFIKMSKRVDDYADKDHVSITVYSVSLNRLEIAKTSYLI